MLKALAGGGVGAAAGLGAYGFLYERHALQVVQATLPVSGLAPEHEGLRIGLLTDLHHSQFVSQEQIAHAASLVLTERPDLIVLGGDYVTDGDPTYMRPCVEALSSLTAPHGVYATLGNHDDDWEMPGALTSRGFVVLRDARTTLTIRGAPIDLAGIRFWTQHRHEIAHVVGRPKHPTLLLAHDPRRLTEASSLGLSAVLAGHTHGGQVVVPGLGAVAARRFPVVAGLAQHGGTSLFVSRGVGTIYVPVRINCPPDVAILTLIDRV